MKNWKKLIVTAAIFGSLALLAGCTTASAVSLEEAKDLVKDQMGARDAVVLEQETDREDGVYELEIVIDGVGYEFEVDSRTGQVREVERETNIVPAETQPVETAAPVETAPAETKPAEQRSITLEEAKAIAYAHAGVSESEACDKSCEADDGKYEIDFDCDGYEYEYDISCEGRILKSHKEKDHDHHDHHDHHDSSAAPAETQPRAQESQRITAQEALTIAMNHAGVSDARDKDTEWDDGCWEVSFESGSTEYEYHISAEGQVLRWEEDRED